MRTSLTASFLVLASISLSTLTACGGGNKSEPAESLAGVAPSSQSASAIPSDNSETAASAAEAASQPASMATATAQAAATGIAAGRSKPAATAQASTGATNTAPSAGRTAPAAGGIAIPGEAPVSVSSNAMPTGEPNSLDTAGTTALAPAPASATTGTSPAVRALATSTAVTPLLPWMPLPKANLNATSSKSGTQTLTNTPVGVRAADLVAQVVPGAASIPKVIGVQCQGVNTDLSAQSSVFVTTPTATSVQRFGSAGQGTATAQRFEVGATDKLAAGTPPRCENLVYPGATGLHEGETFWHVVEMWTDDWSGTTDDQLILQWHQDDARLVQNPYLAVLLKGSTLRVELRSNSSNPSTKASNVVYTSPNFAWPTRQWNTLILQGRISPNPALAPRVRVWLNGTQLLDRQAPLGYYLAGSATYFVKWGIYKWTDGNPWDTKFPVRSVMTRNMLLVRDPTNRYSVSSMSTLLNCTNCTTNN